VTATVGFDLALARGVAREMLVILRPACERIEIGGSIRRGKARVKDIELVAIPKTVPVLDMFGEVAGTRDLLHELVTEMSQVGVVTKRLDVNGVPRFGQRAKMLCYHGIPVDLFTAQADNWGLQFLIRTGPAEFNRRVVTRTYDGGLLPFTFRVGKLDDKSEHPSYLWQGNTIIPTPEERDFFAAIGLAWVEPEDR
jgi:DNA polymerase/3'-5' exonuclease PolX